MVHLYGSNCSCHDKPSLIVQSRKGGQVSQNCVVTGRPRKVTKDQLPEWSCKKCGHACEKSQDRYSTYIYVCTHCKAVVKIADLVPDWDDYFEEYGFDAKREQ